MSFCTFSNDFTQNNFISIENKFITKYMPRADATAVKVYLYGLYLCQNNAKNFTLENCAEILGIGVDKVAQAFSFWEDCDLVQILCKDPFTVEYLPVSSVEGRPKKVQYEKYADFNKELQRKMSAVNVFLTYSDLQKYMAFLQQSEMEQQAFLLIVEYVIHSTDGAPSNAQIFNKAKNFEKRGLITYSQVEKALSDFNVHTTDLVKILSALSIRREPCEDDYALLDGWQDKGFAPSAVLECAKHLKHGSMQTLASLLEDCERENAYTKEDVAQYLTHREMLSTLTFHVAKCLGVKVASPLVYNQEYTGKWYDRGYDEEVLCKLALFCVKTERGSFGALDELIDGLYLQGIVSLESVDIYLDNMQADLKLLAKIQKYCASIKKTEANLSTVSTWRKWNFSDEMMIEAAKRAQATSHPVPYINKILSDWKSENVFTIDAIPTTSYPTEEKRQLAEKISVADEKAERERYYSLLRTRAQDVADRNLAKANENAEFKKICTELSDANRECVKAEVFHNENLPLLQQKVSSLTAKKVTLLHAMGLTESDLQPQYQCKKCSDSGFLPNGRACDCYLKAKK